MLNGSTGHGLTGPSGDTSAPNVADPAEPVTMLADLKKQWSDVLMTLEAMDRVAWMVWFDARLADFDGRTLTVDFSDPQRFDLTQRYPISAASQHRVSLESAILAVTGRRVVVEVRSWQP